MVNFSFKLLCQTFLSPKIEEERWETSLFFKNQEKQEDGEEHHLRIRKRSGSFYENLDVEKHFHIERVSKNHKDLNVERVPENPKDLNIESYSDIAQRLASSPTTAV
jgi:hypothetical protein